MVPCLASRDRVTTAAQLTHTGCAERLVLKGLTLVSERERERDSLQLPESGDLKSCLFCVFACSHVIAYTYIYACRGLKLMPIVFLNSSILLV